MIIKNLLLGASLIAYLNVSPLLAATSEHSNATDEKWLQLFDGKSLTGWVAKFKGHELGVNYKDTFRIQDNYLTVSYDNYEKFSGEFGHLFYQTPYSHYRIRATYRFLEHKAGYPENGPKLKWAVRNNGLMLHSQAPETMKLDQNFPASIEVQLLGGLGEGDRPTANICTPDTHVVINKQLTKKHCIKSSSKTFHGDQWVTIEVEVRGNEVMRNYINGELVFELTQPQLDGENKTLVEANGGKVALENGYIAIQAETHPIQFKSIELLKL